MVINKCKIRLDINNGRTLCQKCDSKLGWNYQIYKKTLSVDSKWICEATGNRA